MRATRIFALLLSASLFMAGCHRPAMASDSASIQSGAYADEYFTARFPDGWERDDYGGREHPGVTFFSWTGEMISVEFMASSHPTRDALDALSDASADAMIVLPSPGGLGVEPPPELMVDGRAAWRMKFPMPDPPVLDAPMFPGALARPKHHDTEFLVVVPVKTGYFRLHGVGEDLDPGFESDFNRFLASFHVLKASL